MSADFSGGSGTEDDPYKISTPYDLVNLSKNVSNGNNYSGKYFKVMVPMDLSSVCNESSGVSWIPIGNYISTVDDLPFRGTFDGGGHTISKLYINNASYDYQGLFGYTLNANITNVNLTDVNITGSTYVGSLVGCNYAKGGESTITNCNATGHVNGSTQVGGLIGYNDIWKDGIGTITNCSADGEVCGNRIVGGFIGREAGGRCIIKNCYATANVLGTGNDQEFIGGLIGHHTTTNTASSIITNCYAIGDVSGEYDVGGLVGFNYVWNKGCITITNCYAAGNITGIKQVGGLVGFIRNNTTELYAGKMAYVNNSTALNQYVNGNLYVGRIVGINEGRLADNYAWEGMKNGDNFFTENIGHDKLNGENVSSVQVWANKTIYKDNLKWDFIRNWTIIENDNNENKYPLPYLKSLGKDDSLRAEVLYLKPVNVTFNNSSGKGTMYDQVFSKGVPQKLYQNIFTRTGYTFDGWSNAQNGAKLYEDKQSIPVTEDITLYAVWKGNVTNITLYFNNTTSFPSVNQTVNISYDSDKFNTSLTPPTKPGYTFLGYNNSTESSSVQVINGTLKLVPDAEGYTSAGKWNNTSENVELWAVWKANITNVTLHFNNGSSVPNDIQIVNISYGSDQFNETLSPLNYPGYTFLGFFNKSSGGVQVINNALGLVPNAVNYTFGGVWTNDTRDIELWAVWEKIPETTPTSSGSSSHSTAIYLGGVIYTVYFNSTGGSHVDNQTDLRYGEKVKEPDDPIKYGFIFDAWYTKDDYKWDFKNDTVNDTITLYAKWNSAQVPTTPTQTQTPIHLLGILAGIGAAAALRRK